MYIAAITSVGFLALVFAVVIRGILASRATKREHAELDRQRAIVMNFFRFKANVDPVAIWKVEQCFMDFKSCRMAEQDRWTVESYYDTRVLRAENAELRQQRAATECKITYPTECAP